MPGRAAVVDDVDGRLLNPSGDAFGIWFQHTTDPRRISPGTHDRQCWPSCASDGIAAGSACPNIFVVNGICLVIRAGSAPDHRAW